MNLENVNNDLTILLLLKGRDAFTIRWFEYAKSRSMPYKVIVADGGHDEGLERELCKRKFSQHVNYEYIRYPFDEDFKTFYAKVLDALTRVKTPLVVLGSNDDFYFFEAMESSVRFLKETPEFVASRGEIWDFNVSSPASDSPVSSGKGHVYGEMRGVEKIYFQPTVAGDSATDRVTDFSRTPNSVWHDVVRTEKLREAYGALVKCGINDLRFADSFISLFVACHGKMCREAGMYMLHQSHPDMAALTIVGDTQFEWIDSPGWRADFDRFLNGIAREISALDKIPFHEAKCSLIERYLVDGILKTMVRDFLSPRLVKKTNKERVTAVIKSILRKNSFAFNAIKKIASRSSGVEACNWEAGPFADKLEAVSRFLKNRK